MRTAREINHDERGINQKEEEEKERKHLHKLESTRKDRGRFDRGRCRHPVAEYIFVIFCNL